MVQHLHRISVLVVVALLSLVCDSPGKDPEGRIVAPRSGATFVQDETFDVRARMKNVPRGHKVYVCVVRGDLLWPKTQLVREGDQWTATIAEGGEGKNFSLTLLLVSPAGEKVLARWFATGKAKGEFPGLTTIPGSERLDTVRLKLK